MGGAATVLGTIYAVSKMKLNINIIGLIPAGKIDQVVMHMCQVHCNYDE